MTIKDLLRPKQDVLVVLYLKELLKKEKENVAM
jgi:hypothetical protein